MAITRTTLETFVSPDDLKAVILDFASYPELMKEVKRVEIHSQDEAHADVTFHLDVSFAGFRMESHYRVRYTIDGWKLSWKLVESPTITKNQGSWTLEATDDDECVARYEGDVETNLAVPPEIQAAFAEQELPKLMAAIRDKAEG